jgi:hypothetical protein
MVVPHCSIALRQIEHGGLATICGFTLTETEAVDPTLPRNGGQARVICPSCKIQDDGPKDGRRGGGVKNWLR